MKYNYTAVFTQNEDKSYSVYVPDLPGCATTGKDIADAIEMIKDAASLWLVCAEDDGDIIPKPTPQSDIILPNDALYSIICIDTFKYRAEIDNKAVRKNVTLPVWMANMAEKKGFSLSQVLQDSLAQLLSA